MLSVIIATRDDAATLSAALADLVPAAVDGLVREVIIADAGSTDATLEIADDAGAVILRGSGSAGESLAAGCAAAKSAWLLVLPPSPLLAPGWERPLSAALESAPRASFWLPAEGAMPWSKASALLVSRVAYDKAGGFQPGSGPVTDLLRRLAAPKRALKLSGRGGRR
jgi:hypothetical protein